MEYKDLGRYIPIIYLLYSWGSRFGVPSRVPLTWGLHEDLGFWVGGMKKISTKRILLSILVVLGGM